MVVKRKGTARFAQVLKRPAAQAEDEEEEEYDKVDEVELPEQEDEEEEEEEEDADEEETATTMKRPAAKKARLFEDADGTESPVTKKTSGVLKKPAAIEEGDTQDSEEVVMKKPGAAEIVAFKKPAGAETILLKKPAAADHEAMSSILKKPAAADQEAETSILKKPAAVGEVVEESVLMKKPAAAQENESQVDVAGRKKELNAMAAPDLKELVLSKDLESGNKKANVEAILAFEAKEREAAIARKQNAHHVADKFKQDLAGKSASELAELCQQKGLKKGGGKDEKVQRLCMHAEESGDIARAIAASEREKQKQELSIMDKASLYDICIKKGIDPLNKEVMIDRIIANDSDRT